MNNNNCFKEECHKDYKNLCQQKEYNSDIKEAFIVITNTCNYGCPYCFQKNHNNTGLVKLLTDDKLDDIFNVIESKKYNAVSIRGGEVSTLTEDENKRLFKYVNSLNVKRINIGTGNLNFNVNEQQDKTRITYHIRGFDKEIPKTHHILSEYIIVLYPYQLTDIYNFIKKNNSYTFKILFDLMTPFPNDKEILKTFKSILSLDNVRYRCSYYINKISGSNLDKIYITAYMTTLKKLTIDLDSYKIYTI